MSSIITSMASAILASPVVHSIAAKIGFFSLIAIAEDLAIVVTDINSKQWLAAFQEALVAAAAAGLTIPPTFGVDVQKTATDFAAGNFTAVFADLQKDAADVGLTFTVAATAP